MFSNTRYSYTVGVFGRDSPVLGTAVHGIELKQGCCLLYRYNKFYKNLFNTLGDFSRLLRWLQCYSSVVTSLVKREKFETIVKVEV